MRLLTILLLLLMAARLPVAAQQQSASLNAIPLDDRLAEFSVRDTDFVDAVSVLSRQHVKGLHLGLEEILRERASDPPPQGPHFSATLYHNSVREILDILCSNDRRYTWTRDGATINIFPRRVASDPEYLLNRKIDRVYVTAIPDPEQGLAFLYKQLPPPREQLGYASGGGNSSYPAPFSEVFTHLTVRQFINRLSEHMGFETSWIFYGSKQERLFTFVKGGFH